jgi:ABC-2 type transport system permease protein
MMYSDNRQKWITLRPLSPFRELNAIWVFVKRDLRLQMRFKAAFVTGLAGTIPQLVIFGLIVKFGYSGPELRNLPGGYVNFVISGLVINTLLTTALSGPYRGLMESYWSDRLEILMSSPLRLPVFIVGVSAGNYPNAILRIAIYLTGASLFLGFQWPGIGAGLAVFGIILALSVLACTGLGLLAASSVYTLDARGGQDPVRFVVETIAGLLAGVYFPLEKLPVWAQWLAFSVPHTYAIDGMRRALFGADALAPLLLHHRIPLPPLATDALALAIYAAIILPCGWAALRYGIRLARRDGRLSRWI